MYIEVQITWKNFSKKFLKLKRIKSISFTLYLYLTIFFICKLVVNSQRFIQQKLSATYNLIWLSDGNFFTKMLLVYKLRFITK